MPGLLAQVRLNELLAANTLAVPDIVDFEDYPDWIELYNPADLAVSLEGVFLSDDPANPLKWGFPATASIVAGGHLVVWADGHDADPGQSHPRGYWPWRNFVTEGWHTNFALSSEGESVMLTRANGLVSQVLVNAANPLPVSPATAAVWRYLANGSDQGSAWRGLVFDDSTWPSGPGKLGYSDSPATVIPFGPDSNNKYVTTYFRHEFQVADPAVLSAASLRLLVDDGAVVYLNGGEIVRQNLPDGAIDYQTLALDAVGGSAESAYTAYRIPVSKLLPGTNVLAVEVHQNAGSSTDLGFDLGLSVTTFTSLSVLDSLTYGPQVDDVSFGRDPQQDTQWVSLASPTPGAANSGAIVQDLRQSGGRIAISRESGFHNEPIEVTMNAASGVIRYTLDGSLPRENSAAYDEPLTISSTTVLRTRVFEAGRPHGPVETRSYFFGENASSLPVVSVVADPAVLFDDRIGIYYNKHEPLVSSTSNAALGMRDAYKGKDAPGCLEFFEPGGVPGFRVNGGFRIGGENNWVHAQRALNFFARGKYGGNEITYDLFPGSGIPIHASLTLRDGGDAWDKEMFRDGMWPFIIRDRMMVNGSDYRPSVVYINGSYWGIHNIRSRWDDSWFFHHHRADAGNLDHLLYGHVVSSSVTLGADKGNTDEWLDLIGFLNTRNLALPENYAFVESRIDIDSFIDFVTAEGYGINTSWRHNREFWRERKPGAKWRWFLPDMDQTFRVSQLSASVLNDMLTRDEVLSKLKTNPVFVGRLAQRFSAHVASTFKPARINAIIDAMAADTDPEVARHISRWAAFGGMTNSSRASYIQGIKDFAATRDGNVHAELQAQLGVGLPVVLTLTVNHADAGRLRVCGVPVDPGAIRMFPGIDFELTAEAAPGFRFSHWTGLDGGEVVSVNLSTAATVIAHFEPSEETVLGGTLLQDTVLSAAGSPYTLDQDLIVPAGILLTIEAGVVIRIPERHHIRVQGRMWVNGLADQPIEITGRNGASWGGISFENPDGPSTLRHLIIRDATRGHDPRFYPSAVSALNAILVMEHLDIDDSEAPIFVRGGSTILRSSRLHSRVTGDCINIKSGDAEVWDSVFIGNNSPDTDAIDYDGVTGGIISGNRIYRFRASNSDAVDIGEQCSDVVIENNRIYHCSDKAFSVGQGSSVIIRRNLVVGCGLGVGVKDTGSVAWIDQNTFAGCILGVDVYEKSFGNGGATATVTNSIFSACAAATVTADAQSSVSVSHSLSDTTALPGIGNIIADPRFIDTAVFNFQLGEGSPAVDAGDPAHAPDPDGSRADIGALYSYSAADYPFVIGNTVVINELLADSGSGAPDWIEIQNRTASAIDIGGWFLSDSAVDPSKYRIPAGTMIPPGGHVVFYEDLHFGQDSIDPGRIVPFALSENGETVFISSAEDDELTDYQSNESFGPSVLGETLGNYYKISSNVWNFVALASPTPGMPNSGPRVGPVVVSEIHYQPGGSGNADAEYFELMNISSDPVVLHDSSRGSAWRVTDGVDHDFPVDQPLEMAPGERIILTRSLARFQIAFGIPADTRVFQWASGRLSNEGEQLQIGRPAGLENGVRKYARMDRVSYAPGPPWPTGAAGGGMSLHRVAVDEYGNDAANWVAAPPSPGAPMTGPDFGSWLDASGLAPDSRSPGGDPDGDGRANLLEYALDSAPGTFDSEPPFVIERGTGGLTLRYALRVGRAGLGVGLECSSLLEAGSWLPMESRPLSVVGGFQQRVVIPTGPVAERLFFRMRAELEADGGG
jgi:hypothetical protein